MNSSNSNARNKRQEQKNAKPSKEPPKIFENLICLIDVVYSGFLAYILFLTFKYFTGYGAASESITKFPYKGLCLIFLAIAMLEDYVTVRIVAAIKPYSTTTRFTADFLIAVLFFFSIELVNYDSKAFLLAIIMISFLSVWWSKRLLKNENIEPYWKHYFVIVKHNSYVNMFLCGLAIIVVYLIEPKIIKVRSIPDDYYFCYFFIFLISTIHIVWEKINFIKKHKGDININPLVKHSGPILSKVIVFSIVKGIEGIRTKFKKSESRKTR
jgi:hypothetical protein